MNEQPSAGRPPAPPPGGPGGTGTAPAPAKLLKLIACEIAFREICHVAARSPNLLDFEFLTQGYHDIPRTGCAEIQRRIDATPAGKYDAILIGYGLCSNILAGLRSAHTPLVVPRAHDCITFFLGSKERYQEFFHAHPGTYYYTSGWLECARRRGEKSLAQGNTFMPANLKTAAEATYQAWVEKFGEEQAQYLLEVMGGWAQSYHHGTLIQFDFTQSLGLREQVQRLCADQGWQFEEVPGDLGLLQRLVDGPWTAEEFLVVQAGEAVTASFDEKIIKAEAATGQASGHSAR